MYYELAHGLIILELVIKRERAVLKNEDVIVITSRPLSIFSHLTRVTTWNSLALPCDNILFVSACNAYCNSRTSLFLLIVKHIMI